MTTARARRIRTQFRLLLLRLIGVRVPTTTPGFGMSSGFKIWLETYDDDGNLVSRERR